MAGHWLVCLKITPSENPLYIIHRRFRKSGQMDWAVKHRKRNLMPNPHPGSTEAVCCGMIQYRPNIFLDKMEFPPSVTSGSSSCKILGPAMSLDALMGKYRWEKGLLTQSPSCVIRVVAYTKCRAAHYSSLTNLGIFIRRD